MAIFSLYSFSPYYHPFFTAIALLVSALIFFLSQKSKAKKLNLPPGPAGWPVVGNLFQVSGSGKPFFQFVRDIIPKYGPIFTLKMGTRTLIIITDASLAHEALIEKGQIFASRPSESPTRTIFSSDKNTVNSAVYGPVWRSLRRNMVQAMLSTNRVREFRDVRNWAMDRLIDRLRTESESSSGSVWVLKNVRFAVFCILVLMCFGVEMDEETIEKIDQIMKAVLLTLSPRVDDFLPILSPFYSKQRKKALQTRQKQVKTIVPLIEMRRSGKTKASFSYLDTLFDLKIEGRKSALSDDELVTLCSEFLNGGTDTTATAVEWGIARIIENPEIQRRISSEIESTVGDRKVEEKDLEKMEYLNAFTKELLRKHPPTYFVLSHAVTEATSLGGYDIPKEASVEFFSAAISDDRKQWNCPEKFDPDRFFMGKEEADITGVKGVKMLPFGVGRRICPGLSIGTLHINLIIARMVQEFEWNKLPSQNSIDFSEKFEFTVVMKTPLQAMIKKRSSMEVAGI